MNDPKPRLLRVTPARITFLAVFAATMFNLASIGGTIAVLPRLLSHELNASDPMVGFVTGSYALSGILMRPFAGRFADQFGRRPVMIAGSVIAAVGTALLFLPPAIPTLIASRLLVGLGEGSLYTAGAAWIVDAAPLARRGRWIGLYGLSIWVGLALGAPIAEALRQMSGYTAVWGYVFACSVVSCLFAVLIPRPKEGGSMSPSGKRGSYIERRAVGPGSILMLSAVGFATISGFVILHLSERGIEGAASVFTVFAAAMVLGRIVFGGLPDRYGPVSCAIVSLSAQIVAMVLVAKSSSLFLALAGATVMGVAFSIIFPSLSLLMLSRVASDRRGAAMGTFTALFDSGMFIGTPAAGAAAAAFGGYEAAFFFAAFCALLGALAVSLVSRRSADAV